jgi:hypothetical protein
MMRAKLARFHRAAPSCGWSCRRSCAVAAASSRAWSSASLLPVGLRERAILTGRSAATSARKRLTRRRSKLVRRLGIGLVEPFPALKTRQASFAVRSPTPCRDLPVEFAERLAPVNRGARTSALLRNRYGIIPEAKLRALQPPHWKISAPRNGASRSGGRFHNG